VPTTIRIGPGGQGANVAVRLARLGAAVMLITPIADDAAGRLLRDALEHEGVELHSLPAARSTVVIAMLDPAGERTMVSDRQLLDADAAAAGLRGATWIHCSGYPLLDDRTGDRLAAVLAQRADGVRLSIAGGSVPAEPAVVSRLLRRVSAARPDVLAVGIGEAESLIGEQPAGAAAAARSLSGLAPLVVVTAGALGSAARLGDDFVTVSAPSLSEPMIDATGAGDAFLAALLWELADQWPPSLDAVRAAMDRASMVGAQVARVHGAQGRIPAEAIRA
jgi:sugar/nucleoside kinase (ribokinase family)